MADDPNLTARRDDALPYAPASPPAGGRYALGAEIARGGMGAVFRATDTALGREVAVKLLQEQFGPDSGTARRFADEARIAGQLQHPGIPPIHDFGTLPDGRPFLAMKLIKGDTLDELLRTRRDPGDDRGRFVAVFEAVCQAVGYAHSHDVIHRDLKPANVMVGAFGEVQVMDWGLAKVLQPGAAADGTVADVAATAPNTEVRSLRDSDDDHTQAGAVMGTPAYMPPEQAAGAAHKVTPRSDVFGLGAVLAVILTGRPPFVAGSAETTRVKAAQGDVADCLERLDGCGAEPELVALCKRCLSPKPADRPATAGEVASAVADFRARAEARARQAELDRVTSEATAAEQRKRRRVQAVLAAALVLLVAGAGGVAVWRVTEAARVEREQQDRATRAMAAVGALLDQARTALEAGDAARAAPLLDQAHQRSADGRTEEDATRLTAYRRDLAMLRALDGVNDYRWTPLDSKYYPPPERVVERWAAEFANYGIVPGTTPRAEVVARVNSSPIRTALVAAMDGWLALSRSTAVRDLLAAADPNPFRDEVRLLLAAGDAAGLAGLAGRVEWTAQPSGLVQAYGRSPAVPVGAGRDLLLRLVVGRRTDFALLMHLGATYPLNTAEESSERARWYQAAVGLRPENAAALSNLGSVLRDRKDLDGAEATCREAIRLDPKYAPAHNNLGNVFRDRKDLDRAAVAFREAIRLDPKYAFPHNNLGTVLHDGNNLDGAAAAYREAIRLDQKFALPHSNLGLVLWAKGEPEAAEAEYREAIRLDPTDAHPHSNLGNALYTRKDRDGAAAAFREAVRLDPTDAISHKNLGFVYEASFELERAEAAYREAVRVDPRYADAHADLGDVLRKQARHAEAVVSYRTALAIKPTLGYAGAGLDYCLRVQRGEVPTAPPPRAVAR